MTGENTLIDYEQFFPEGQPGQSDGWGYEGDWAGYGFTHAKATEARIRLIMEQRLTKPLEKILFGSFPNEVLRNERDLKTKASLSAYRDMSQRLGAQSVAPYAAQKFGYIALMMIASVLLFLFTLGMGASGMAAWVSSLIPALGLGVFEIARNENGQFRERLTATVGDAQSVLFGFYNFQSNAITRYAASADSAVHSDFDRNAVHLAKALAAGSVSRRASQWIDAQVPTIKSKYLRNGVSSFKMSSARFAYISALLVAVLLSIVIPVSAPTWSPVFMGSAMIDLGAPVPGIEIPLWMAIHIGTQIVLIVMFGAHYFGRYHGQRERIYAAYMSLILDGEVLGINDHPKNAIGPQGEWAKSLPSDADASRLESILDPTAPQPCPTFWSNRFLCGPGDNTVPYPIPLSVGRFLRVLRGVTERGMTGYHQSTNPPTMGTKLGRAMTAPVDPYHRHHSHARGVWRP